MQDTVSHQVKFCEDAVFWDVAGKGEGMIDRRLLVTCDPHRYESSIILVIMSLRCPQFAMEHRDGDSYFLGFPPVAKPNA